MKSIKNKIIILSLISFAGCNYNVVKQAAQQDPVRQLNDDQISYPVVMDQVFTKNCVGCHSGSGGNKGGVNLETYASTKRWIKEIGDEVAGKKMPPPKKSQLSDDQIRLVNVWVAAGAPEVAVDPAKPLTPPPAEPVVQIPNDPKDITFTMVKSILLEPRCFKCHADPTNKGDVNLETYENVKTNLQDMYDDIKEGSMPRGNDKILTDDQLKIFFDWYDAGALENGVPHEKP